MSNALIVHDNLMLSRVAHRIEELIQSIELLESILNGTCKRPMYARVDKKQVADTIELERLNLEILLGDIESGMLDMELQEIKNKYIVKKDSAFFPTQSFSPVEDMVV